MAKLAGKNFKIKVGTSSGGSFNAMLGMDDGTMNLSATNVDTSEFGDSFMERLQALKDASYDFKGHYNAADATGQAVVQSAFLNDTALWGQFLPDGTTGFKQEMKVSKFSIGVPVNGVCSLDLTIEGTGVFSTV
jgi:predicted secreted protein